MKFNIPSFLLGLILGTSLLVILMFRPSPPRYSPNHHLGAPPKAEVDNKKPIEFQEEPHRLHEHISSFRQSTYHAQHFKNWTERSYSTPYLQREREYVCSDDDATKNTAASVLEAVRNIRKQIEAEFNDFPVDIGSSLYYLRSAVNKVPSCASYYLNYLIALMYQDTYEVHMNLTLGSQTRTLLRSMKGNLPPFIDPILTPKRILAKLFLWNAILIEYLEYTEPGFLTGGGQQAVFYDKAFEIDPSLLTEYFHPTYRDNKMLLYSHQPHIVRATLQILFYYEYASSLGAYVSLPFQKTQDMRQNWFVQLKGPALPPFVYAAVTHCYRTLIDALHKRSNSSSYGPAKFESSGDPINSFLNHMFRETITKLAGAPVVATYGFTAGYEEGDYLKPHTDRQACEFSVTILLSSYPTVYPCAIYASNDPLPIDEKYVGFYYDVPSNATRVVSERNDVVILRGRSVRHFRKPLPPGTHCTTLLLHFIPA
eukprot:PhF_6_TR42182/c0_g1_i2/m.63797